MCRFLVPPYRGHLGIPTLVGEAYAAADARSAGLAGQRRALGGGIRVCFDEYLFRHGEIGTDVF